MIVETSYLDCIPTPAEIRQRIAGTYREARLLKALLRLSEQRELLAQHRAGNHEGETSQEGSRA